jgi:hypothetical protein
MKNAAKKQSAIDFISRELLTGRVPAPAQDTRSILAAAIAAAIIRDAPK